MKLRSIFETDFYKLTMGQVILLLFYHVWVRYELIVRIATEFPPGFAAAVMTEIKYMSHLQATPAEIEFLKKKADFLSPFYLEWIKGYRFNPNEVLVEQEGGNLSVTIEGPWYRTVYWEVPLMAIISELYFEMTNQQPSIDWVTQAEEKSRILYDAGVTWTDFGVRRAYSRYVHENVLSAAMNYQQLPGRPRGLVGTSCVSLAAQFDLLPIGTMAHEMVMANAVLSGPQSANLATMDAWMKVYKGRLGTALPDTFTTDVFLRDFTHEYAKAFDGLRQDSGDPFVFAQKVIAHYKKLGIDPKTKTLIFSDSLNVARMIEINEFCKGKIGCSFGYGTGFTNDVGVKPLNMVIKMTAARASSSHPWLPAVKLSDDAGKVTNSEVAAAVRLLLGI